MARTRNPHAAAVKAWLTRRRGGSRTSASTGGTLGRKLAHELTALDIKESRRELKRYGRENIYRLSHYLRAADEVKKAVRGGKSLSEAFASNFNPTRGMHGVARRLGLGLTVQRGQWRRRA